MSNPTPRLHVFRNDALGEHDAVALAKLIRARKVSPQEAARAAIERAEAAAALRGVALPDYERAMIVAAQPHEGVFAGVPTYVKDNSDVAGLPTRHGSLAVAPRAAKRDGFFVQQYLAQGFVALGKSRLPEFGFNATTEFKGAPPTLNPWHMEYSSGASSGGSAVLVASGAVPIAHANDGGGSIRLPAACCGLVGLKPSRGRFIDGEQARSLPVNIISEGVVTRSVRDTAHFFAGMERTWRNPKLPEIGLVERPGKARLRIGLVVDSITGPSDADTRATVTRTAKLLESLGHRVEEIPPNVPMTFPDDFKLYWGLLGFSMAKFGSKLTGPGFDASKLDNLTLGLARMFGRGWHRTPAMLYRLARSQKDYAQLMTHDAILSPVLAHTTPRIGYLSPEQPFEPLFEKLGKYVAFTPLNNAAGSPAISLPMGATAEGLPIAVQLQAAHGAEKLLLELAFELEEAQPFRRIQDLRQA